MLIILTVFLLSVGHRDYHKLVAVSKPSQINGGLVTVTKGHFLNKNIFFFVPDPVYR